MGSQLKLPPVFLAWRMDKRGYEPRELEKARKQILLQCLQRNSALMTLDFNPVRPMVNF